MGMNESDGTAYAADNSSDHSSSATHSPRHKPTQYVDDSPFARKHLLNNDNHDLLSSQPDLSTTDKVRTLLIVAQVYYLPPFAFTPPHPAFASNLFLMIDVWPIIY